MHCDSLTLYRVNCSACGQPTVVTGIEVRPDLCDPCFTSTVTAP